MSTPRQILGNVINKQYEEDWTKYQALGDPSPDAEGKAAETTNLDFLALRSERKEHTQRMKQEKFMKQEQSARSSRKPWKSQQTPKWFDLEAYAFGSCPSLIETE